MCENVKGWRTLEVQRSKEPSVKICIQTRKLTTRRRSSRFCAWNAPWHVSTQCLSFKLHSPGFVKNPLITVYKTFPKISKLPNYQITKFPYFQLFKLLNFQITKFPYFQITKFLYFHLSKFPNYQITQFPKP